MSSSISDVTLYDFYFLVHLSSFFLMIRPPPRTTLFPSTQLFRSQAKSEDACYTQEANGSERGAAHDGLDRKSTRLNSSHVAISYAVFCLKKKKKKKNQ